MKTFRHTANIVHGTPWMIEPQALAVIAAIFQRHLDGEEIPDVRAARAKDKSKPEEGDWFGPMGMITRRGMVDVIQIHGPILPRASMGNISSTVTGSAEIGESIRLALESDSKAIVLDIDSPGGSVLGIFEAADQINLACAMKHVVASVSGLACSAAYLLASQADSIVATRASIIGSIGVISTLDDAGRLLKNEGVDSITVASSRRKAMSGLSEDEMRDEMQTDVTQYFSMMKDTINRKRKGLVAGAESFPGTMISGGCD